MSSISMRMAVGSWRKGVRLMAKDEWGEVVQFLDGWCYGVAPDGATICCGREDEVRAMLADQSKRSSNPVVDDILDLERKLQNEKEVENGKAGDIQARSSRSQRVIRTGNVRARPDAHTQYKPVDTRQTKTRKGLPRS